MVNVDEVDLPVLMLNRPREHAVTFYDPMESITGDDIAGFLASTVFQEEVQSQYDESYYVVDEL